MQIVHIVALAALPGGHTRHTACAASDWNVPGAQVVQVAAPALLDSPTEQSAQPATPPGENVPFRQFGQLPTVAVVFAPVDLPAGHDTQGVAAVESSSLSPVAHITQPEEPVAPLGA